MGKYKEWNEFLCEQLCEEMKCFKEKPTPDRLERVEKLIKSISGLQEIEAAGAMRQFAEDRYGYDSDTASFENNAPWYFDVFNASRRRDSRGRFTRGPRNNMWDENIYTDMPYRGEYNPNVSMPMFNNGDMYNAGRGSQDGQGGRSSGNGRGRSGSMYNAYPMEDDYDGPYMLRQENGRPIMTPYAAHDKNAIPKRMTKDEYKEWMETIENEDGTDGAKWEKQEIEGAAKKAGIDVNKFGPEALWATTNMMYSDYCHVAKKFGVDRPEFYICMAEAFLDDADYNGDGVEKLSTYYHTIVNK